MTQFVAEMVVDLSEFYGVSSDDIVVFIEGGVPGLEEQLDPFTLVDVYVIVMCYIFEDSFQWPWTVYDMVRIAVHQRGRTQQAYELRAFHIISAQSGGTISESQDFLPDRGGMYERGGMPRQDRHPDPRTAMIGWAVQKASEHNQEVHPSTMTMLCRAEARTTHALLNSRSPSQTQHILQAAFRRASLTYPSSSQSMTHPSSDHQEVRQQEQAQALLPDVLRALQEQTQAIAHQTTILSSMPTRQQHEATLTMFDTSQRATIEAMASFAQALNRLEGRVATWESTFSTLASHVNPEAQRDPQLREEQDVSDSQSVTPRYSDPGIGEEGGERDDRDNAQHQAEEPEQTRVEEHDQDMTQPYEDDGQNLPSEGHSLMEVNGTILIDDDHDDENPRAHAADVTPRVAERVSILEALAQRSQESQGRLARGATQPFGAARQ